MASVRAYYRLGKPGIIWANVMTALAGYLFGSEGHPDFRTLLALFAGTWLVIAGACVFNNYTDRRIDTKMARTSRRSLVTGEIKSSAALILVGVYELVGFVLLAVGTNSLTVIAGLVGLVDYTVLYAWAKRHNAHSTLIGSISGSMPIVAGYAAATARLDLAALILFLVMTFWQMPHFYAIGLFRKSDYAAANLPILSVGSRFEVVRAQIIVYMTAFIAATALMTAFNFTGELYFVLISAAGFYWLWLALTKIEENTVWAKRLFGFSLIILVVFSTLISVDHFLPNL